MYDRRAVLSPTQPNTGGVATAGRGDDDEVEEENDEDAFGILISLLPSPSDVMSDAINARTPSIPNRRKPHCLR